MITLPGNKFGQVLSGVSPMPTEKTLDGRIAEEFCSYLDHPEQKYKILNGREVDGPENNQPQFINLDFISLTRL